MTKREILLKLNDYLTTFAFITLTAAIIFKYTIDNIIFSLIIWTIVGILFASSTALNSYLHYSNEDYERNNKRLISVSFKFELVFLVLNAFYCTIIMCDLLSLPIALITSLTIILTACIADFLANLAGDKYRHSTFIIVSIFHLIFIVLGCISLL